MTNTDRQTDRQADGGRVLPTILIAALVQRREFAKKACEIAGCFLWVTHVCVCVCLCMYVYMCVCLPPLNTNNVG
jgi:hypothetical protein